ncbi:hypothetical protein CQA53_01435 [Helicobacter didelphidarum]|uniref:Methicillin resistance protein n=1 Tax=Helicobacter didelphidarum TaxID=2040648 RepID=A0A3D8IR04_9HELI|nr:hypothetical protein [Helicobacter didelphidarum]RDU67689.1 hypothetical protein CQA53_01435 [Helicobacter didelphidarum]
MSILQLYSFIFFGFVCGLIALVLTYILSVTMRIMQDRTLTNKFKIHHHNTPRCGGIGIFLSLIVIAMAGIEIPKAIFDPLAGLHLYIACFIIMLSGTFKDSNRNPSIIINITMQTIGFLYFIFSFIFLVVDSVIISMLGIFVTLLFLFFTTNSINVIDGVNGNAIFYSIILLVSLCFVGYQLQINFVIFICTILLGICFVFLLFNFPYGKMFLGDGGAFLLGFIIGALLFICVWYFKLNFYYALTLFIYPLCEFIASICTRWRHIKSYSFAEIFIHLCEPNNYHLHFFFYAQFGHYGVLILNSLCAIFICFITLYYDNTLLLLLLGIGFCIIYMILFFSLRTKKLYLYNKA